MKLHKKNNTPSNPIEIVESWGTSEQVDSFIEDIWPINWTKENFDHYVSTMR